MLGNGLLERLLAHLCGNFRDQAAWADDGYRFGFHPDLYRFVALIVAVNNSVDDHFLNGKRIIGIHSSRDFGFESELEVDQRKQVGQFVELAPQIASDRTPHNIVTFVLPFFQIDIVAKAPLEPMRRSRCLKMHACLRELF